MILREVLGKKMVSDFWMSKKTKSRRTPPQVGTPNAQVHKGHDEIHVFEWKYSYGNEVNRFTNVISSCGLIM